MKGHRTDVLLAVSLAGLFSARRLSLEDAEAAHAGDPRKAD
jgi:hypothetical protein